MRLSTCDPFCATFAGGVVSCLRWKGFSTKVSERGPVSVLGYRACYLLLVALTRYESVLKLEVSGMIKPQLPLVQGEQYEILCFLLICSYHYENLLLTHYNVAIAVELVDYRKVQRLSEYSGQIPGLESRKLKTVGLLPGTRARKDG